jgi:hypothetical protein
MRSFVLKCFSVVAVGLSAVTVGCGAPEQSTTAAAQPAELRIATPTAQELPEEARAALSQALSERSGLKGPATLINLRWEGTWALGTVTLADLEQPLAEGKETHLDLDVLHAVLLVRTEQGWEAAIEGDERLQQLLERVPESGLVPEARAALFPRSEQLQQQLSAMAYSGYKFFWPASSPFVVTQSWHDPSTWGGQHQAYHGIDFDVSGATNADILAGAPGTVTHMCNDGTQVLLTITTSGTTERLGYLHLDTATVAAAGIGQGSVVTMGKKLGRMVNSDGGSVVTNCGQSYGTHLHMYFPYKPITLDGKVFSATSVPSGLLYSTHGTSSTTEVIVDNTSAGFLKYGPAQYWYTGNAGYGGTVTYTYANGTAQSNYAQWKPSLPSAGYYTVYAHIPSNYATSQQARYRIWHNGANNYATVNQNIYSNAWVSLGQHYFSANGTEYVELSDATGEALSLSRMIGFDAIKFVK